MSLKLIQSVNKLLWTISVTKQNIEYDVSYKQIQ